MNRIASLAATVFGIGYFPYAPGTVASLFALPFAWLLLREGGVPALGLSALAATVLGIWVCDIQARESRVHDPSECVIDEVAGQWFACALSPCSIPGFALAFVLFRVFDIAKFWPVSRMEKLPGGFGVMMDDVVAGLLAGAIVAALSRLGLLALPRAG